MNLREETIKVLRPLAELANDYFEWQPDATQLLTTENIVLTLSDARRARTFLSRLEAGSGEETGWQPTHKHPKGGMYRLLFTAWTPDVPCELAIFEDIYRRRYARSLSAFNEAYEALNQEGGDAAAHQGKHNSANGQVDRPHVATPAPGENSERAEAKAPVRPEHAFAMVDGLLDASDRYNETGSISSLSVRDTLRKELIGFIEDQFAAGRRSMREEAAKVVEGGSFLHNEAPDARLASDAAAAIRAIPEKQS